MVCIIGHACHHYDICVSNVVQMILEKSKKHFKQHILSENRKKLLFIKNQSYGNLNRYLKNLIV